jgi:L-arabinonolactonase
MPEVTSSFGLRCRDGLVAATRTGFVFLDTATGHVTPIVHPEADVPGNRFNDGKVDRAGRFWAGTKNLANNPEPTGSLYRLDCDGAAHLATGGISCSNGIAWSPDNRTMYLCDTWVRRIYAFDFADSYTKCNTQAPRRGELRYCDSSHPPRQGKPR